MSKATASQFVKCLEVFANTPQYCVATVLPIEYRNLWDSFKVKKATPWVNAVGEITAPTHGRANLPPRSPYPFNVTSMAQGSPLLRSFGSRRNDINRLLLSVKKKPFGLGLTGFSF